MSSPTPPSVIRLPKHARWVSAAQHMRPWLGRLLIIALVTPLLFVAPAPKRAEAAVGCVASLFAGIGAAAAANAINQPSVPVKNPAIEGATVALETKSCSDEIMTVLFKPVINAIRDIIIRWIITGRFQLPVFSLGYGVDIAQVAENASKIFLSELSGINFCQGFDIPNISNFALSLDLGLTCTLPSNLDQDYTNTLLKLVADPASLSLEEQLILNDPSNNKVYAFIEASGKKREGVARAVIARAAEYIAGQGFLDIKDANGKVKTPGTFVGELVKDQLTHYSTMQAANVQTVQQAVIAIIDTAVKQLVFKGLDALSKQGGNQPGQTTYTCDPDVGACVVDSFGIFSDLASCEQACASSSTTYNCVSDACVVDSTGAGQFSDLQSCQGSCPPPPSSGNTYDCVSGTCAVNQNGTGTYPDLPSCEVACQ